jgi:hypothetical protein
VTIDLFPNPATDNVWISLKGFQAEVSLNVMDAAGRLAASYARLGTENTEQILLSVSDLLPGIYTIMVQDGNQTAYSRLVVQ